MSMTKAEIVRNSTEHHFYLSTHVAASIAHVTRKIYYYILSCSFFPSLFFEMTTTEFSSNRKTTPTEQLHFVNKLAHKNSFTLLNSLSFSRMFIHLLNMQFFCVCALRSENPGYFCMGKIYCINHFTNSWSLRETERERDKFTHLSSYF